jgi:hypothetical protein
MLSELSTYHLAEVRVLDDLFGYLQLSLEILDLLFEPLDQGILDLDLRVHFLVERLKFLLCLLVFHETLIFVSISH